MDELVLTGVRPYDGAYGFDVVEEELTTREWGWVKRFSGYLPLTIDEGLAGLDPELVCVIACIVLRRHGKLGADEIPALFERLRDEPFGAAITIRVGIDQADQEGDEETDPTKTTTDAPGASWSTAGDGSKTNSETSGPNRPGFGTPGLVTSE